MALPAIIGGVLGIGETLIKRLWPDPVQQAEALLRLEELKQKGDLAFLDADVKLLTGQIEINKMEAIHGGLFKGGWRPFVGWICGLAMAYKFLVQPFIITAVQVTSHSLGVPATDLFPVEVLPSIEWSELSVVLLGMLGLGTLRTYEKTKQS